MKITEIIQNRKVILYGDERYICDFLYLFDMIIPEYIIDDEEREDARKWEILRREDLNEIFVIICKYIEKNARNNLELMGLQRGVNYISADALFSALDFQIEDISKDRNVYVWGTGAQGHWFFHECIERYPNIEIYGCIDSDEEKWNKRFFRRTVYSPVDALNDKNGFYIIASIDYYIEIRNDLIKSGKIEGLDFIHFSKINKTASWMARETIYDVPKIDYICMKPFTDAVIYPGGALSVCSGVRDVHLKMQPIEFSSFDDVWSSNIMKILRLSVFNGTFSFCDGSKCNYLFESSNTMIDKEEIHYCLHRTKEEIDSINRKGQNERNYIYDKKRYDIKVKRFPDTIMCAYDMTCNLSCPSCREEGFSIPLSERNRIERIHTKLSNEVFSHVKRIKVAGLGEAFASKCYNDILFNSEATQNKDIGILSNGMLLTKEKLDLILKRFRDVKVFISMDGATKITAEKLRRGVDFELWKRNMSHLGEARQNGKISFLAFNFVVQKENYMEMPEFIKMCLEYHADKIKFSKLFNWGKFSDEKYKELSMFDLFNNPKSELEEIINSDLFKLKEVNLFEWVNW